MDIFLTARMQPSAAFFAAYRPADALRIDNHGRSLLWFALGNKDVQSRYEISNALLDDGCPLGAPAADGATTLHILFGQTKHDVEKDTALARRLMGNGADVNALDDSDRLPFLEVLNMKFTDEQLEPLYDLWFEQPRLDFLTKSHHGVSPIDFAAKLPYRARVLDRMERYVAAIA